MANAIGGITAEAMAAVIEEDSVSSVMSSGGQRRCLTVDCRPFIAYNSGHVIGASNVHCPPILKRRAGGNLQLQNVVSSEPVRAELLGGRFSMAVFYDDRTTDQGQLTADSVILMAIKVVQETGRIPQVYILQGGYESFSRSYGHLCRGGQLPNVQQPIPTIYVTRSPSVSPELLRSAEGLVLGDGSTRIAGTNTVGRLPSLLPADAESAISCSSSCRREISSPRSAPYSSSRFRIWQDQGDPVFILPWLYIGNSYHASQEERLSQLGVNAKLNVAGQQPSLAYTESRDFRCMSIPVTDTSTENISSWFPRAIEFIENVRRSSGKVLVHCQAGISRSATICIAYLMYDEGLTLDQAYDFIQARRSIISPNMNFMRQLAEYEKQLQHLRASSSSPSPSSGSSSSLAARPQRSCPRSYDLPAPLPTRSSCSSNCFPSPYSGRHSSPSVLVTSPYPDQKHARRIRRASTDLDGQHALRSSSSCSQVHSTVDSTASTPTSSPSIWRWSQPPVDDGEPAYPRPAGTPGILFPIQCSATPRSPLVQST